MMKAALVLLIPLLGACVLAQQFGGQQRVIISENLLPVETAQALSVVEWLSPLGRFPIYCVASQGAQYIRFSCPDCNITDINSTLAGAAVDMSGSSKFPSYKLGNVPVSKYMNGKTLVCEARFQDSQTRQQRVVQATVTMNIQYFERPVITDENGNLPLNTENGVGKRFYIQRNNGQKSLRCMVDSNPPASSFVWTASSRQVGTGQATTAGSALIGNSIQCSARSTSDIYPDGRNSDSVRLEPWDTPTVLSTNFQALKTQGGVFTQGDQIMLQKTLTLQCVVTGNPAPTVMWMQQSGAKLFNASCTPTMRILNTQNNQNNFNTRNNNNNNGINNQQSYTPYQSDCTIQVNEYNVAGKYWCSACNSIAQNSLYCNPSQESPSGDVLELNVIGKPLQSDVKPYVIQTNRQSPAYVYASYCADPEPTPPRQVYWTIGDERVNVGERKGNFVAERPQRNASFPDCYQIRLVINPVTSSDEKKRYQLSVVNRYGNTNIPVPVQDLFREQWNSNGNQVGLAVGLTLGILVLLIIILVAICFWKRLCCFAGGKKTTDEKKFHSNLAPDYRSEPVGPPPKYDAPPVNGYGSERGTNGYDNGYNNPRRAQEGMTYAEMDLVREPARISPSNPPPTDYSTVQHSYQLKSPTNSVV